jgi:hypothetical protein
VSEGDRGEVPANCDRADADEDEREGADELSDPAADPVLVHGARLRLYSDDIAQVG